MSRALNLNFSLSDSWSLKYCVLVLEKEVILTIAKSRLESLELPRLDGHDQDQAHCGGEQRGQQEVGDRPERDHPRHLNKV